MAVSVTGRPNWVDKNSSVSRAGWVKMGSTRFGFWSKPIEGPAASLVSCELMRYLAQGLGQSV